MKTPFIITAENKVYIFLEGQGKDNEHNHKEVDTRIIFLAYKRAMML